MTPVQIVSLVVGLLVLQVAVWVPILLVLRRKNAQLMTKLGADVAASGEKLLRGPEPALYRGATDRFSKASGNGVVALTDKRLVIRKIVGAGCEVPLVDVQAVRDDKWFRSGYKGGRLHVILQLAGGTELGFIVQQRAHAAWMEAFRERISARS